MAILFGKPHTEYKEFFKTLTMDNIRVSKRYHDYNVYLRVKCLYQFIKHIPYVIEMEFDDQNNAVIMKKCGVILDAIRNDLTLNDKQKIKDQLIDFIKQLNAANIAHMDLHYRNICYDGSNIKVIDWDFIEIEISEIGICYDLTGNGINNGFPSLFNQFLLKDNSYSILNIINPLTLTIEDFTK